MSAKRILIYRLGSLGDTVVVLPILHLIARAFPGAERRVLSNLPVNGKAAPLSSVLGESGLADGYFVYPVGVRNLRQLSALAQAIRSWRPDVLVYLAEPRGRLKALRDACFFKYCGVSTLVGVPLSKDLQENRWLGARRQYEHEVERLARCLAVLGDARLSSPASWDLRLSSEEERTARQCLESWAGREQFITCSVGSKVEVKDWGRDNWRRLMRELSLEHSPLGLALVGAADEFELSEAVGREWQGPRLNLCGKLTPRESGALMKRSILFIGHDGGPMHLAASVGLPCVAIFSGQSKPGIWFPYGDRHKVLMHETECNGCGLEVCGREERKCITSISVGEVLDAAREKLSACTRSTSLMASGTETG